MDNTPDEPLLSTLLVSPHFDFLPTQTNAQFLQSEPRLQKAFDQLTFKIWYVK